MDCGGITGEDGDSVGALVHNLMKLSILFSQGFYPKFPPFLEWGLPSCLDCLYLRESNWYIMSFLCIRSSCEVCSDDNWSSSITSIAISSSTFFNASSNVTLVGLSRVLRRVISAIVQSGGFNYCALQRNRQKKNNSFAVTECFPYWVLFSNESKSMVPRLLSLVEINLAISVQEW